MNSLKHKDFACKCCGKNKQNKIFIQKINRAQDIAGIPFVITSGYRCEKHNAEVGGHPRSYHLFGLACDILVKNSYERGRIVKALIESGITKIGLAKNFIHCDTENIIKIFLY